jgi:transposase
MFAKNVDGITLVYDKGNNSQDNQKQIDGSSYHFVGSLSPVQHPDLLRVPQSRFHSLQGEDLEGVLAWRTRKQVLGAERTILVTYNPELFLKQSGTILRELNKRTSKLRELQIHFAHPTKSAKCITIESAQKQVQEILSGRHMKELIYTEVTSAAGLPQLNYRINRTAWSRLQHTLLGKNILFTDQDSWKDEDIVRAYRGQHHIEEAFKRMKNPHFVSWRPLHHWTDQKIRVHAFYCVLALLLSSLLRRTLANNGIAMSMVKILATLSKVKEVALLYRTPRSRMEPVISLSAVTHQQKRIVNALNLERYLPPVGHTEPRP